MISFRQILSRMFAIVASLLLLHACTASEPVKTPLLSPVASSARTTDTSTPTITGEDGTHLQKPAADASPGLSAATPTNSRTTKSSPQPSQFPVEHSSTATPLPAATATLLTEIVEASSIPLEGPLAAFVQYDPSPANSILLIDIGTQSSRTLKYSGMPLHVSWSTDGCALYVALERATGHEMVISDLQGNISRRISLERIYTPPTETALFFSNWTLSPCGRNLAYMVSSGQQYYSTWEFQDARLASLQEVTESITVTQRGGLLAFSWSPDGRSLAYNELDELGTRQLCEWNVEDKSRTQITFFSNQSGDSPPIHVYGKPVWSPDGSQVAFLAGGMDLDGNVASSVWISGDGDRKPLQLMSTISGDYAIMGWREDGSELAVVGFAEFGAMSGNCSLYQIDVNTGSILDVLPEREAPDSDVKLLAAVRGVSLWVGRDPTGETYLYDWSFDILEKAQGISWPMPYLLDLTTVGHGELFYSGQVREAAISPSSFPGETACQERDGE